MEGMAATAATTSRSEAAGADLGFGPLEPTVCLAPAPLASARAPQVWRRSLSSVPLVVVKCLAGVLAVLVWLVLIPLVDMAASAVRVLAGGGRAARR